MRIKKITVKNLFGIFNHEIPLNTKEHITIIHGPNGYGKTILLAMLKALSNADYFKFWSIPFDEFVIEFDNSDKLKVLKSRVDPGEEENNSIQDIRVEYTPVQGGQGKVLEVGSLMTALENGIQKSIFERFVPNLRQVDGERWYYLPSNEMLSFPEVVERFGQTLPLRYRIGSSLKKPDWALELNDNFEIHLIETQRLLSFSQKSTYFTSVESNFRKSDRPLPSILVYSEELQKAIREKLAEYGSISQKLDRTFPTRLVKSNRKNSSDFKHLRKNLEKLEVKRSQLISVGFLEKEDDIDFNELNKIDESDLNVLSVYVDDVEQKLSVFDDLTDKIDLLVKIINSRFLYKTLSISKHEGFVFTSSNGKMIPLAGLSSGEQHELVLLYKLLFRTRPDNLVLIDEPEMSLHVVWQRKFLKDLQEITKIVDFDVLIATHSPSIINDRMDLAVGLEGPED